MITTLANIQINDRIILPPLDKHAGYYIREHQRRTSRRVLSISMVDSVVTIVLDGEQPRTLPADLKVLCFR